MTITFGFGQRRRAALAWASCFTAKGSSPMGGVLMGGVLMEVKDGELRFVASDGVYLAYCEGAMPATCSTTGPDGERKEKAPDCQVILPMAAVKELLKAKSAPALEIDLSKSPSALTVRTENSVSTFTALAGRYPNWRHAVPAGDPLPMDGAGMCLDLKRVATVEKAAQAAYGKRLPACGARFSYYGGGKPVAIRPALASEGIDLLPVAWVMQIRI